MKVWCMSQFTDVGKENAAFLRQLISTKYCPESTFRVAIVGGGPKGVYAIERLASWWQHHFPERCIDMVVFNETDAFASGPNYDPTQPDYLLMNYPLGRVSFWTDEPHQLVSDRPSLREFLMTHSRNTHHVVDAEDYTTRALTGAYLQHSLVQVIKSLPGTIRLHLIKDTVNSIEVSGPHNVTIGTGSGVYSGFSEVLCCTGHSYRFPESENAAISQKDIFPVYPVSNLEAADLSDNTLLIRGLGLSFVDALLALTVGRGGTFYRCKGRMCYRRSGNEPRMVYAFSRTGLPMIPRQKEPLNIPLRYCTPAFFQNLSKQAGKVDFEAEVLPLMAKEFRYRYARLYSRFSGKHHPSELTSEELELRLKAVDSSFASLDIEEFLSSPLREGNLHGQIREYMEATVYPYAECVAQRARLALTSLWREISPHFSRVYAFGKLTGHSQRLFDTAYRPSLQRLSYGPPQVSMEKIIALIDSGLLDLSLAVDPQIYYDPGTAKVHATSRTGNLQIQADRLIDARVPGPGNISSQPPYIQRLVQSVGAAFFCNQQYQTGCLELTAQGQLAVAPSISFYGTPTEGCTFDNESLSRQNNNLLTPWTQNLIETYEVNNHSNAHANSASLD